MLTGYDYVIEKYVPLGPNLVVENKQEGARRLTAYLIKGIQSIYFGHVYNKKSEVYATYKKWFTNLYWPYTILREEEIAVKQLLIAFDTNFKYYSDSTFFRCFLVNTNMLYTYYIRSDTLTVLDVRRIAADMMSGDSLKPLRYLNDLPRLRALPDSVRYMVAVAKQKMPATE